MMEEQKKLRDFFRNNLGYFAIALLSIIYILTAAFVLDPGRKSLQQIFGDSAVIFLLGMAVNRMFDVQGMLNGNRDERYLATIKLHGDTVTRIAPIIDKLDEWCEVANADNLKLQRTKILATHGMKYEDYFGENGKPYVMDQARMGNKITKKDEIARYNCYKRALQLKLTQITSSALTSESSKRDDPFYFGETKQQYERRKSITEVFTKIITAIAFGYFSIQMVQDFSWQRLIWTGLQMAIILVFGVVKMYTSYIFITDTYRSGIVMKIDNLQKFEVWANRGGNNVKCIQQEQNETNQS